MNYKKIAFFLIILIFLSNQVLSLDTILNFKLKKGYQLQVRILNPDGSGTLEKGFFKEIAGDSGTISINYSSNFLDKIHVSVMVKDDQDRKIFFEENDPVKIFRNIKTGWVYEIDLNSNNPVPVQLMLSSELYKSQNTKKEENISKQEVKVSHETSFTNQSDSKKNLSSFKPNFKPLTALSIKDFVSKLESYKRTFFYSLIVFSIITISFLGFWISKKLRDKKSKIHKIKYMDRIEKIEKNIKETEKDIIELKKILKKTTDKES